MLAAEERPALRQPVTDDVDAACRAGRRQRVDGAFEAVEGVTAAVHHHLERFVVIVAAGFASGHGCLAWLGSRAFNRRAGAPVPSRVGRRPGCSWESIAP